MQYIVKGEHKFLIMAVYPLQEAESDILITEYGVNNLNSTETLLQKHRADIMVKDNTSLYLLQYVNVAEYEDIIKIPRDEN